MVAQLSKEIDSLNSMHEALALEAIVQAIVALPPIYATDFPALPTALLAASVTHCYKHRDCMYHALFRVVW